MKKISTLLLAAASVALAANAADLTPVAVEIANPSFEENNIEGWTTKGEAWNVENWYAMQNRNKSWTDGNWGIRSASDVDIEGANYMYQTVVDQKLGTYVLQVDGYFARNNWKGNIGDIEGARGYVFIADDACEDTDLPGTEEEPATGISATYGVNMSKGENYFITYRFYVVHTTDSFLDDFGSTGITIGLGYPGDCPAVSKARFVADNFVLRYFDTTDTDAVKEFVNAEIADIEAGKYSNEGATPNAVINPSGNVDVALQGFQTNTGRTVNTSTPVESGITDIAAPAVKDNKYYNLQGIEIAKPTTAGLYIHNGKKYIVK